jgi:hypothetical protein
LLDVVGTTHPVSHTSEPAQSIVNALTPPAGSAEKLNTHFEPAVADGIVAAKAAAPV